MAKKSEGAGPGALVPGQFLPAEGKVVLNAGRKTASLIVTNTGDRPIQVGSHYHFFEVNRALRFDRDKTFGMRLDIPAGTSVRFEPGEQREVGLVALGGSRFVYGLNDLTNGSIQSPQTREKALRLARERGFQGA